MTGSANEALCLLWVRTYLHDIVAMSRTKSSSEEPNLETAPPKSSMEVDENLPTQVRLHGRNGHAGELAGIPRALMGYSRGPVRMACSRGSA